MDGAPPPPPYGEWGSSEKKKESLEDQVSFMRTVRAFKEYRQHALEMLEHKKKCFDDLSPKHKALLGFDHTKDIFDEYRKGIHANADFLDDIVAASDTLFESYWPERLKDTFDEQPTPLDMDKVYSTLRQFVRDWSFEGLQERNSVYEPVKAVLERCFPDVNARGAVKVLLPGAGLSRISLEIAMMGFFSQGNEFSYHMLIAGHYILNHAEQSGKYQLAPYVDSTINLFSRKDQFRRVPVPFKSTMDGIIELEQAGKTFGDFSMVAGDFTDVYTRPHEIGAWNAVGTCFFIDTAHNIIEYLEILWNLLAPGGIWINVGPLLYHFADTIGDQSIDLSLDELMGVIARVGFQVMETSYVNTGYTNNYMSMKQMVYRTVFFWAVKPLNAPPQAPSDTHVNVS